MKNLDEKWLVITEKPSVANDIVKALGDFSKKEGYYESNSFIITWAIGHLLELLTPEEINPLYKRWLLQDLPILPENFEYKPKKGQTERVRLIKSLSQKKDVVGLINACDAGREGELIFREIYDYCHVKKPFQRLWLQSLTSDAIKKEFASPRPGSTYDPLGDAARCRMESDWLIGINGTRAITRRLKTRNMKGAWSVGRVQTPTLALIVRREREHLDHRSQKYFTIEGTFSTPDHQYNAFWYDPLFTQEKEDKANNLKEDRIFSKDSLEKIIEETAKNKENVTASETRKESKEIAPMLFDLTTLQREANRKFGMSASRTLQAAQRLYEKHKILTYPRTDSKYLPQDYQGNVNKFIDKFAGKSPDYSLFCQKLKSNGLLNKSRIFNDAKVSDHHAIIPTGELPTTKIDGDDLRIFDLVVRRFLAAFYPPAVWAKVERITKIGTQHFRTRVQDLEIPGWREVYGVDSAEGSRLPKLTQTEKEAVPVHHEDTKTHEDFTKPPPRYSEAKLLSLMEHCGKSIDDEDLAEALREKGIGTPATRADIIENLILKEYVIRTGKNLKATSKGIRLVDILEKIPIDALTKVELTGEMEHDLKKMERKHFSRQKFMENMSIFTTALVEKAKGFDYEKIYEGEPDLGACPLCKSGKIVEGFWNYYCKLQDKKNEKCDFVIWKEKNYRYVDRHLVSDVLEKKIAGPFEFSNTSGTTQYEEFVTLDGNKGLVFCTAEGEVKETADKLQVVEKEEPIAETYLKIPGIIKVTSTFYMCEFAPPTPPDSPKKASSKAKTTSAKLNKTVKKIRKVTSRMPKILCGREISFEEYKNFIITGTTEPIFNFVSKKGRTFAAILKLKDNGNFEFKFISKKDDPNYVAPPKKPRVAKTTKKKTVVKKKGESDE